MTYLEAAIAVLKASRQPMTAAEITAAALERGLIPSRSRTPEASMRTALYVHNRSTTEPVVTRESEAGRRTPRWRYVG